MRGPERLLVAGRRTPPAAATGSQGENCRASLRQIQAALAGRAGQRHQALCQPETSRHGGVWTHGLQLLGSYFKSIWSGWVFT